MVIEFDDSDGLIFDEIIEFLESHMEFQRHGSQKKSPILLFGLEIYPEQRKVYCNTQEVDLTAKEYDLLYLLVANRGQTLTYSQIYERVWREDSTLDERKVIGFHVCNLREKFYKIDPKTPFTIRSVREVGYCLEMNQ